MSNLPTTQNALFIESLNGAWVIQPHPVHVPAAGEVLVRIEATALNPVDWKTHDYGFRIEKYPALIGLDAAGVIVAVGEGVETTRIGERVAFSGMRNDRQASFQQYAIAHAAATAKIPAGISFDQAASLPVATATAALRLYTPSAAQGGIGLTAPWKGGRGKYAGEPILILGGSSAVGQAAIQLAALSGLSPIITTVSPRHNALVTSLGVTHPLDRNLDEAALTGSIRSITAGKTLRYVLDTISLSDTQAFGYRVLADADGGSLLVTLPSAVTDEDKAKGKKVNILNPVVFDHIPFVLEMYVHLPELLEKGNFKPIQVEYVPGGLASIPDALDRLRKNQISGVKLVVRPQETS